MEIKTFRAPSMQEALQQVRCTLGPSAAVLQAREVPRGMLQWVTGSRQVEVLASADLHVPSRLPPSIERPLPTSPDPQGPALPCHPRVPPVGPAHAESFRNQLRAAAMGEFANLRSLVEDLSLGGLQTNPEETIATNGTSRVFGSPRRQPMGPSVHSGRADDSGAPEAVFCLFTELLDAGIEEELARELIDRVCQRASERDVRDALLLKTRLSRLIEEEIRVCQPISVLPSQARIVALIGPTGVGKTTTIAKLATNHRLRERRRVGLVTVDTYRIAATEQLRTYADLIDLPMEIASTPQEMRQALDRLSGSELILMDTAGRSPCDEVRIQALRSLLAEAQCDEIHLVLSSVASTASLKLAVEQFAGMGVTALVLTKLDEAPGLGNLLPVLRNSRLPISYLANGQGVPDDIEPADSRKLARIMLGIGRATRGREFDSTQGLVFADRR